MDHRSQTTISLDAVLCFIRGTNLSTSLEVRIQIGSKHVERVLSSRENETAVLRVEAELFHVLLALMEEHKLRWNVVSLF